MPYTDAPEKAAYAQGIATTFADQGDPLAYQDAIARGATEEQALEVGDNGIGHESLGRINTNQNYGIAVPEESLRRTFGNDPAAWRKARAHDTSQRKGRNRANHRRWPWT
jgi:hypothetical protein